MEPARSEHNPSHPPAADEGGHVEPAPYTFAWWISDTAVFIGMTTTMLLLTTRFHAPLWPSLAAGGLLNLLAALTYLWWAYKQYYKGWERWSASSSSSPSQRPSR
jgi:membrane protein YdbS with pleckstrin-like domain